ncbi:MAG: phosphoribosylanthranilate isomerase [Candidatus Binataceae bacterium]
MAVRVKICGVTRVEDARIAAELGADFIGLNFHPPSPRYLTVERAREMRSAAGGTALVGVFVNAARDYIRERLDTLKLDLIQFHGDEDEDALAGWPVPVIRALRLNPESAAPLDFSTRADYVLLDRFHPELFGGTGKALPLGQLSISQSDWRRVFISGGLNADNVAAAAALMPYAVDVASGIESAPGVKDEMKLRSFIAHAKSSG